MSFSIKILLSDEVGKPPLFPTEAMRPLRLAVQAMQTADAPRPVGPRDGDVLLSCDDRLCRLGRRFRKDLTVRVADLLEWSKEVWNAPDIE